MKSRYVLLFLVFFITNNLFAESNKHLCVLMKSGTQIMIAIEERPKITFDGTIMRIGDGDYQIDNVQSWEIDATETVGIKDDLIIKPNEKLAQAKVFNAAGMEIPVSMKKDPDGRLRCDMSTLPIGFYIIQIGNETLKVMKR